MVAGSNPAGRIKKSDWPAPTTALKAAFLEFRFRPQNRFTQRSGIDERVVTPIFVRQDRLQDRVPARTNRSRPIIEPVRSELQIRGAIGGNQVYKKPPIFSDVENDRQRITKRHQPRHKGFSRLGPRQSMGILEQRQDEVLNPWETCPRSIATI